MTTFMTTILAVIVGLVLAAGWIILGSLEKTLILLNDSLRRIEARLRALEQAHSPWAAPADEDDE